MGVPTWLAPGSQNSGRLPAKPDHRHQQARKEGLPILQEVGQQETSPADLLAERAPMIRT